MNAIKNIFGAFAFCLLIMGISPFAQAQDIPKPVDYFGFEPGADSMLFNYEPLIQYLQ